jgi:hypothetical protein
MDQSPGQEEKERHCRYCGKWATHGNTMSLTPAARHGPCNGIACLTSCIAHVACYRQHRAAVQAEKTASHAAMLAGNPRVTRHLQRELDRAAPVKGPAHRDPVLELLLEAERFAGSGIMGQQDNPLEGSGARCDGCERAMWVESRVHARAHTVHA